MVKKLNVIICILISLYLPVHAAEQQWLPLSQQYDIDSVALAVFFKNKQSSLWLDKQQFTSHAHDAKTYFLYLYQP